MSINCSHYLGAALGTDPIIKTYDREKVAALFEEVESLSKISSNHKHAAYVHGLQSKSIYLCQTNQNINNIMKPLEANIHQNLLPNITG